MIQQKIVNQRKNRKGQGFFPPNPNQWPNEQNGLDLRDELGISEVLRLPHDDAFKLLQDVIVLPHGLIPMAQKHIEHFRNDGQKRWSGVTVVLPGLPTLVAYNDEHPPTRVRATLMEEFFHIRLGHPTDTVRVHADDGQYRNFNAQKENEAFGSGAAALVPYKGLNLMLADHQSVDDIAKHFKVSNELVLFRTKVTKIYSKYIKNRH